MGNDKDYLRALEELDREFPGIEYDDSMVEYLEERRRLKKIKSFLIKRGIFLLAAIILFMIAITVFPLGLLLIILLIIAVR
jgi:hypothetical protein